MNIVSFQNLYQWSISLWVPSPHLHQTPTVCCKTC